MAAGALSNDSVTLISGSAGPSEIVAVWSTSSRLFMSGAALSAYVIAARAALRCTLAELKKLGVYRNVLPESGVGSMRNECIRNVSILG